jgi:hypothetical protein
MDAIKGVLKEELENSLRLLEKYREAVGKLPRGSLVEKNINGNVFCYLAFRQAGKVKFAYQGKLSKGEIEKLKEIQKYRAKYRKLIADLKQQILFLKRALHERKRRRAG